MLLRGESAESPMSQMGQKRTLERWKFRSGLLQIADIIRPARHVRSVPRTDMTSDSTSGRMCLRVSFGSVSIQALLRCGCFFLTGWQSRPTLRHQRIDKGCRR
jgi:hypothetical protein